MVKTFARIALAVTLIGGLGYNTYAVVADATSDNKEEASVSETTLVSVLLKEQEEDELTCEQMVARIDQELTSVDSKLDENPFNEAELLDLRRGLVELRLEQPCHSEVMLAQTEFIEQPMIMDGGEIIGEPIFEEEIIGEEIFGGPISGGSSGGGYGGGGGGGGGLGGGGLGGLLPLAGLAGLAGLGGDDPASLP